MNSVETTSGSIIQTADPHLEFAPSPYSATQQTCSPTLFKGVRVKTL